MYDVLRATDHLPGTGRHLWHIGRRFSLASLEAWFRRRSASARVRSELHGLEGRELSELGLTAGDIPFVARGTFRQGG